jgi:hypothetical protein
MKKLTLILITVFVGMAAAGVKYVAVVETGVDASFGASAKLTRAEVRQITAELRKEAVNNLLPQDKYNIMTSETVIAQGGAVLEECAEENCVIKLGSTIGRDASAIENIDKGLYTTADKQVKQRNTAYILGSIILLSGITVHIFF